MRFTFQIRATCHIFNAQWKHPVEVVVVVVVVENAAVVMGTFSAVAAVDVAALVIDAARQDTCPANAQFAAAVVAVLDYVRSYDVLSYGCWWRGLEETIR